MPTNNKGLNPAEQLILLDFIEILESKRLYARDNKNENFSRILEYFLELHTRFIAIAETEKFSDSEASDRSYLKWRARSQAPDNYNKIRQLFSFHLAADFERLIGPDGFLDCKRKQGEVFSKKDWQILYELQSGKLRNGEKIDIYDLYFSKKYQVDHVKSLFDGGETVIYNGEILTAEDNNAKGSDSAKPAFGHQRQEVSKTPQQELEI